MVMQFSRFQTFATTISGSSDAQNVVKSSTHLEISMGFLTMAVLQGFCRDKRLTIRHEYFDRVQSEVKLV